MTDTFEIYVGRAEALPYVTVPLIDVTELVGVAVGVFVAVAVKVLVTVGVAVPVEVGVFVGVSVATRPSRNCETVSAVLFKVKWLSR